VNDGPIEEIEVAGEELYERLRDDVFGRDGYIGVLIMTLVTMVAIPLDLTFRGGALVSSLCIVALVVIAMSRSKVPRRLTLISFVVTGSVVGVSLLVTIAGQRLDERSAWLPASFTLLYTAVIALCFPVILRQAFSHKRVTLDTVAAALSAYLLIGLIFAGLYRFCDLVAAPMFSQPAPNGFTFEYFSYITVSTVGYGDFTPANDLGRTLAMLEALLGQAFLVTIVALVVSNLGRERAPLRARRRPEPDA
jgi:hypothetical protein